MRFFYLLLGLILVEQSSAQLLYTPEAEFEKIRSALYDGKYSSYRVDLEVRLLKDGVAQMESAFMEMHISEGKGFLKTDDFDIYAEPNFSILIDHAEQTMTVANAMQGEVFRDQQIQMFMLMIKEPGMHVQVINHQDFREILVTAPGVSLTRYSMRYNSANYHLQTIEMLIDPNVELSVQYQDMQAIKARYSQIKKENGPFPYTKASFIQKTKAGYQGVSNLNHYQVEVQ